MRISDCCTPPPHMQWRRWATATSTSFTSCTAPPAHSASSRRCPLCAAWARAGRSRRCARRAGWRGAGAWVTSAPAALPSLSLTMEGACSVSSARACPHASNTTPPTAPPSLPPRQDRVRIEAEALVAEAAVCPQHVPAVYHYDARMCIIAMQARPACIAFCTASRLSLHASGAAGQCAPSWWGFDEVGRCCLPGTPDALTRMYPPAATLCLLCSTWRRRTSSFARAWWRAASTRTWRATWRPSSRRRCSTPACWRCLAMSSSEVVWEGPPGTASPPLPNAGCAAAPSA